MRVHILCIGYIICLTNSSFNFQVKTFLFYKILVWILKICIYKGFWFSLIFRKLQVANACTSYLKQRLYRSWYRKITISEIFTGVLCTVGGTLVLQLMMEQVSSHVVVGKVEYSHKNQKVGYEKHCVDLDLNESCVLLFSSLYELIVCTSQI
jgi:hypothetical protein